MFQAKEPEFKYEVLKWRISFAKLWLLLHFSQNRIGYFKWGEDLDEFTCKESKL